MDAATPTDVTVGLTAGEVELLKNALRSFVSDFGHDEADVLHRVKDLLAKLSALPSAG
jgi:hypothetical protein